MFKVRVYFPVAGNRHSSLITTIKWLIYVPVVCSVKVLMGLWVKGLEPQGLCWVADVLQL